MLPNMNSGQETGDASGRRTNNLHLNTSGTTDSVLAEHISIYASSHASACMYNNLSTRMCAPTHAWTPIEHVCIGSANDRSGRHCRRCHHAPSDTSGRNREPSPPAMLCRTILLLLQVDEDQVISRRAQHDVLNILGARQHRSELANIPCNTLRHNLPIMEASHDRNTTGIVLHD